MREYRFRVDLSDVERGVYQELRLEVDRRENESPRDVVKKAIAYLLNAGERNSRLEWGLAEEDPMLRLRTPDGATSAWIEVRSPARFASAEVPLIRVYSESQPDCVDRKEVQWFALSVPFLETIERTLARNNVWTVVNENGSLFVNAGIEAARVSLRGET